jgi:uncharacterized Zn finger protein
MNLSDINEAMIRQEAGSPEVFQRGENYRRDGAVEKATLRGDTLTAEVEGSEYNPYRITVRLGKTTIQSAECTCPYGDQWDGWCKHIVATLLLAVYNPEDIDQAPPLAELLARMDRDALHELLLRVANQDPHLADTIAAEATAAAEPTDNAKSVKSERRLFPVVDTDAIRRQIRRAIRNLDQNDYDYSEDSGQISDMVTEILDGPIHSAEVRLEKGDARGTLATLEAIMTAYLSEWTDIEDSDDETLEPFYAVGRIAAEALFSEDAFSPSEQQGWVRKLTQWQKELKDYGASQAFSAAIVAGERGWDDPALQRFLRGEVDSLDWSDDEWGDGTGYSSYQEAATLPDILLNVLERRGQNEEALRLALITDRLARATTLLVKLGRTEETIRLAERQVKSPQAAREIANALKEADEMDTALTVAELGLAFTEAEHRQGRANLALWVRDAAEARNRPDLARQAAFIAVREMPNISNWVIAEQMAASSVEWYELRNEILKDLQRLNDASSYGRSDLTPIFLHENQIDDALKSVRAGANHDLLSKVADAALTERPEAVLKISRREAEAIMDEGKSGQYETARDWLRRYKTALTNLERMDEWPAYREELLVKHKRRYKLIPLLQELG